MAGVLTKWQIGSVVDAAKKGLDISLEQIGERVVEAARGYCPVRTGRLWRSIAWRTKEHTGGGSPDHKEDLIKAPEEPGRLFVGTKCWYGHFVEFGTVKMSAIPFMRPALEQVVRELEQEIARGIKYELERT